MGRAGSRLARVALVLVMVGSAAACGDDDETAGQQPDTTGATGAAQPGVFFGTVGLTTDRDRPGPRGRRRQRQPAHPGVPRRR